MGLDTGISWTNSSWNAWMGCMKLSEGCTNCYAETLTKNRMGLHLWGPAKTTKRQRTSPANWRKPVEWNRDAQNRGQQHKVFCGSLMDWAEDHPQLDQYRTDLWALIRATPHLTWQLLTKRADRIAQLLPLDWYEHQRGFKNVWLGVSVENQEMTDERLPHLLNVPATRFISAEPLLGPIDLRAHIHGLAWVIIGGESGPKFRPMKMEWARSLRDQCVAAGATCFMKQAAAYRSGTRPYIEEPDGTKWVWKQYPNDARAPELVLS